jgi:hypothetical protein
MKVKLLKIFSSSTKFNTYIIVISTTFMQSFSFYIKMGKD